MFAVLGLVGFAGWRVLVRATSKKPISIQNTATTTPTNSAHSNTPSNTQTGFVDWSFNDETWAHQAEAPDCESPLTIGPPMDVQKATSVLYPGQVRGGDYKPHGGIGIDNAANNTLDVYAIRDAYAYRGSRYIEAGEVQYLLDFMDPCGVMYRYDHLATPTAELMTLINQLPEPMPDDSRTTKFNNPLLVKKGTVIATTVGYSKKINAFFDLGVFDLRAPNTQSKTEIFKTDPMRVADKEQSYFALCWFELLPESDKVIVTALPPRGGEKESSSDYCN